MEIVCKKCGKPFNTKHKNQKYCSRECFSNDKQDSKTLIKCLECGEDFRVSKNEKDRVFCSQVCYWKNKNKSNKKCPICGNDTNNDIYCSKECYGKSKRKEPIKYNKICKCCNKPYSTLNNKSEYCSRDCYWKFRKNNPDIIIQSNQGKNFIIKTCKYCKKEYDIQPYRDNITSYCSQECHYKDHHITKKCPTCGKYFDVTKGESDKIYCSNSCVTITRDSKFEREIRDYLSTYFTIERNRVKLENRTIFPDILVDNKIIECYGDYWHCNPNKYGKDYYHSRLKKTASEIWDYDEKRKNLLENNGYNVLIIWEHEYKNNTDEMYKKINEYYEIC